MSNEKYQTISNLLLETDSYTRSKCIVLSKSVDCSWFKENDKYVTDNLLKTISSHISKNWTTIIILARKQYLSYLYKWFDGFDEKRPNKEGEEKFIKKLAPYHIFVSFEEGKYKYCGVTINDEKMMDRFGGHTLDAYIGANGKLLYNELFFNG